MLREWTLLGVLGVGGMWATGMFDPNYSRVVDRPPAQVAAAIADLDIRDAEGAPGTDPSRSGGVAPTFSVEEDADRVSYIVLANGQVATKMTAWLKPIDNGTRTKVTATVERGDAPDDYVAPAFRSTGVTMGLFSMMLEEEIDKLVFPPKAWTAACDEIMARFENGPIGEEPQSMTQAMGQGAKTAMVLGQLDKDLKAAGCPSESNTGAFREPVEHLKD